MTESGEYRVFGPPGTGKTHYLTRQIAKAVATQLRGRTGWQPTSQGPLPRDFIATFSGPPPPSKFTHQQRINKAFPPNYPKKTSAQLVVTQGLS